MVCFRRLRPLPYGFGGLRNNTRSRLKQCGFLCGTRPISGTDDAHVIAGPGNQSDHKSTPEGVTVVFDESDYLCYAGFHVRIADIPAPTF